MAVVAAWRQGYLAKSRQACGVGRVSRICFLFFRTFPFFWASSLFFRLSKKKLCSFFRGTRENRGSVAARSTCVAAAVALLGSLDWARSVENRNGEVFGCWFLRGGFNVSLVLLVDNVVYSSNEL